MLDDWLVETFSSPDGLTLLGIAAKTAAAYVFVVAGMRLLGTRQLGRLNAYDFVLVVVIANSVQNAMVGGDNTLVGGLTSAVTLLVLNYAFTWLLDRFPRLQKRLVGEPVILVNDGRPDAQRMQREGVTRDELMAALREHGVLSLDEVRLAVLEIDGDISVVPRGSPVHRLRRRARHVKST